MPRFFLLALALGVAACASDPPADPVPLAAEVGADAVDTPAEVDALAPEPDAPADDADAVLADPDLAADAPAAPISPAVQGDGLAVVNDTGMTLITLHVAGCTESEGNDWAEMETWATDYLGDEVLFASDSFELDLVVPNCYVMRSQWEDGTVMSERVESTPGMVHYLALG